MSSFEKTMNKCLQKMHDVGGTDKGAYGEQAVMRMCETLYQKNGGILYHSYTYRVDPLKAGNIKVNDFGEFIIEKLGPVTEIDVLYVTKNKIFPIEVKAYKSSLIKLTDGHISGCKNEASNKKSPIHQNEMHARHLYSAIYRAIPNGDWTYIIPICVFVDNCKVEDERTEWQKKYIYSSILDDLPDVLKALDTPGPELIDLAIMDNVLKEAAVKYERKLPVRIK